MNKDPTEASIEWLLGPAIGEQSITNSREMETLIRSVLLRKIAFTNRQED